MAAYKTPGVYVEEIVKFPPSVAQVETAIPAFIGYTQRATKKRWVTRVGNLLELPPCWNMRPSLEVLNQKQPSEYR